MTNQNRNYPTRMHEVLGVEAFERFQIKGLAGHFFLTAAGQICPNEAGIDNDYIIDAINHGIIRKPRLSEEQVKQLQALVTLGFRWLIKNNDCSAYAYTYMPERMDEWWNGLNAEVQLFIDMPTGVLYNLVSWSDPEPLDIVATLKTAGVEVEG